MKQFKVLVLTDHTNHSVQNSLYPLVQALRKHPRCAQIDVATRGNSANDGFFKNLESKALHINHVDDSFAFHANGQSFKQNEDQEVIGNYDAIWLRMPPPLSKAFLDFLQTKFADQLIINDPNGIYETGSKKFLMNFTELCPPMKICTSIEDIIDFKNQFPIVLKPYRDYGGKGIVRIDQDQVWIGKEEMSFDKFIQQNGNTEIEYLGVKFLKNVDQGDKRVIVIDGQIMGASLRLPAKDSWLCNVAMGGKSIEAKIDEAEKEMVEKVNPILSKMGIIMYGMDTLVGDNGRRILSEINTTSIGGLPQIAQQQNLPLVDDAADLIWNYITETKTKKDVTTY